MSSADSHTASPVVVIGGGLVGTCTAAYLQRAGFEVMLLDRASARQAASHGNAGCINGSSIVPVAMPGVLRSVPKWLLDPAGPLALRWRYLPRLAPWLMRFIRSSAPDKVEAQTRALRALLRPALEAYEPLLRDAGADDLVHRRGHLIVYTSHEGMRGDDAAMALRERNGVAIETLSAGDLRALAPALSERFVAGRRIGETGHVADPSVLLARLTAHIVERGGRVLDDDVLSIETSAAGAHAVRTRLGSYRAHAVVVAAGAWSGPLARGLGDRVLLDTERGYHVDIEGADAVPMPILWSEAKIFVTPMQRWLRAAGTVELAGLDAPPDWARATAMLRRVKEMLPALGVELDRGEGQRVSRWLGFRPSTPDSLPVIGRSPRCANVYYAFGHGHVGLTAAASTGRIVADLVAGRAPTIDLAPFSIARFA